MGVVQTSQKDLIDRYFQLAPLPDTGAYLAQFAEDASVEDEGHHHHGMDAIRAWRSQVPGVSYAVHGVQSDAEGHLARTEISGDFPGSPVKLGFRFTFTDDGRVQTLAIRP